LRRRATIETNFLWRLPSPRAIDQRKNQHRFAGNGDMLDAIQISLALWAMIVCAGIKVAQLAPCLL
jgi:hypothetical protein